MADETTDVNTSSNWSSWQVTAVACGGFGALLTLIAVVMWQRRRRLAKKTTQQVQLNASVCLLGLPNATTSVLTPSFAW